MTRIVIFGNSGSGKSTLAKQLCEEKGLTHLDLDLIAWLPQIPAKRKPIQESAVEIEHFTLKNDKWVIEGCYADLLQLVMSQASEIMFLNLSVDACIANARNRPWEPHKYQTKEAQDNNLEMLIDWIGEYEKRQDTFSLSAHQLLFTEFNGKKTMISSNAI